MTLRLREFSLSSAEKAVYRHYYKKLKKLTRKGRGELGKIPQLDRGNLPDGVDVQNRSKTGLMWRGTNQDEIAALVGNGRFESDWTHWARPKATMTYVAGNPKLTETYAVTAARFAGDRDALQSARMGFIDHTSPRGDVKKARIYAVAPSALKRSNDKVRGTVGDIAATAPLRGGIFRHEVRGILKPTLENKKLRWRPVPLGDVQNRNFSAKLRLRELASIL